MQTAENINLASESSPLPQARPIAQRTQQRHLQAHGTQQTAEVNSEVPPEVGRNVTGTGLKRQLRKSSSERDPQGPVSPEEQDEEQSVPLLATSINVRLAQFISSPDRWQQSLAADILLPSIMFTLIIVMLGLTYSKFLTLGLVTAAISLYVSLNFVWYSAGWPWKFLSTLCLVCVVLATFLGCYLHVEFLQGFDMYEQSPRFYDVLPSEPAGPMQHAASIVFGLGTFIDTTRSLSFQGLVPYCVAPIINREMTGVNTIGFWAVGENCCDRRGRFWCAQTNSAPDATSKVKSMGGIVVLKQSPSYHPHYIRAVDMAAEVYGLRLDASPVFVRWGHSVSEEYEEGLAACQKVVFLAIGIACIFPFSILVYQLVRGRTLLAQASLEDVMDWKWNKTEASQMKIGFDWNDDEVTDFALVRDLINARAYWSGQVVHDFVFYLANEHLFIGSFACHPQHPFSKVERLMLFSILAFLVVFPAAALHSRFEHDEFRRYVPAIIILFNIPRALLKGRLKELSKRDMVIMVLYQGKHGSQRKAKAAWYAEVVFFIMAWAVTIAVVITCCAVIRASRQKVVPQVLVSGDAVVEAIVIELLMIILTPHTYPKEFNHIGGKMYFGFFSRWRVERNSYNNSQDEFLWRKSILETPSTPVP